MARRGRGKRSRKGLGGFIRAAYKLLGALNTLHVVSSGNPIKVGKHLARKRTVKFGGRIIR